MNKTARLVVILHCIIVYFLFLGCFLPEKYLIYHLLAFPLVSFHWQLNGNRCYLTDLEYKLNGIKDVPAIDNHYPFMKRIFAQLRFYPNDATIHIYAMWGLIIAWLITLVRLTCKKII
jgi:hypothetical protein